MRLGDSFTFSFGIKFKSAWCKIQTQAITGNRNSQAALFGLPTFTKLRKLSYDIGNIVEWD